LSFVFSGRSWLHFWKNALWRANARAARPGTLYIY
jgi:hypothetical protein